MNILTFLGLSQVLRHPNSCLMKLYFSHNCHCAWCFTKVSLGHNEWFTFLSRPVRVFGMPGVWQVWIRLFNLAIQWSHVCCPQTDNNKSALSWSKSSLGRHWSMLNGSVYQFWGQVERDTGLCQPTITTFRENLKVLFRCSQIQSQCENRQCLVSLNPAVSTLASWLIVEQCSDRSTKRDMNMLWYWNVVVQTCFETQNVTLTFLCSMCRPE